MLAMVLVCAGLVRLLPSLAPIHARDIRIDAQAIEFTDRNGLLLGTILSRDQEHTVAVPLSRISPVFIQAIVAAEDSRFYQHGAVDWRSVVRAAFQMLRHRQVVSGASTITMQLARMLHPSLPTVAGKAEQIWTAWRIAAGMSKSEILEAYCNRVPMGGNVYGVEAAAQTYFGLPASRLNLARATLLASIPNDPSGLSPYEHWTALKTRQAYVLQRMETEHEIAAFHLREAFHEHIALMPQNQGIVAAPHFLFWLASRVPPGTAKLRTTIDRPLQQFVEGQVVQVLQSLGTRNVHHAAALVVDNHTGRVLAYVGSPDYFSEVNSGRNDGVQALRQPGSALKPFLYELALETRAIRPNSILADVPVHYAIPGAMLYSPEDYNHTFQGPVRVRIALADSLNIPAVRVLAKLGVPTFLERLHGLGFTHLTQPADYYGLGLTLGGGEVSLWELTRAYVALARGGSRIELVTVDDGRTIQRATDSEPQPPLIMPDTTNPAWALVTDMLSDSHARVKAFGVGSVLDLPFPAAVKTGTSSDFRDTWTVGYTTDYTVGVWAGNFDGQPMRHVSGVDGAAPLWNRIMLRLHDRHEPDPFAPPGLVLEPICANTGLKPQPDCRSVVYEYLNPQDLAEYSRPQVEQPLPREYDEWLSQQTTFAASHRLRILFPHDNDVFVKYSGHLGFTPTTQALEFEAGAPNRVGMVKWSINGRPLSAASGRTAFWPLQRGRWTIRAREKSDAASVTFEVIEGRQRVLRRGFSLVSDGVPSR